MAAIRCSPRACCGKRLIVVGLVMCSSSSYTYLSVMDSRFNECWYTLHVSYSASCLDENRGKVHVSTIRAFPRFVKRRGNIRLWEVLRLHACSPWWKTHEFGGVGACDHPCSFSEVSWRQLPSLHP